MTKPADVFDVSPDTGWPMTLRLAPPTNPMAVARGLVDETKKGDITAWWRGDFYRWTGTQWAIWPDTEVRAWLYRCTEHAIYMARVPGKDDPQPAPWSPTRKKIGDLLEALGHGVLLRNADHNPDDGNGQVAFTNGMLDLATMKLLNHHPGRFNLHSLAVPYSPDARCDRWLRFLGQVLEDDPERIAILQEWFGYMLCGGTELQKILSMFGPKRCGKGTILRVLVALIGRQFVASPSTLDSLTGTFGLEQLLGARLAILGDVQWTGHNMPEAVGILLGISGEDSTTVQRKHRTSWTGQLPCRFVLAGNDRPKFRNASGALAGRFIYLQFRVSMFGREDPTLTAQLLEELAGIFNWALVGWRRLEANGGRFTESALAKQAAEEVERSSSPVTAFVRDRCIADGETSLDELYKEYERWRATESLEGTIGKPVFSRDLGSALPMVSIERRGSGKSGTRIRVVRGLRLRADGEDDPAAAEEAQSGGPGWGPGGDPVLPLDLTPSVSPGQSFGGPGGPGGPGFSGKNGSRNSASYERTGFVEVGPAIGGLPGSLRVPTAFPQVSAGDPDVGDPGPPSGPPSAQFDPEKWVTGWDQEPPEAA